MIIAFATRISCTSTIMLVLWAKITYDPYEYENFYFYMVILILKLLAKILD